MQTDKNIKTQSRVRSFLICACLITIFAIGAYSGYGLLKVADNITVFNPASAKLSDQKTQFQAAQYERKIYPYSIVRGGMLSREDVYANIRTDHVVAEHYSDFDINKTRIIQAPETRSMYVSYRLGDEVYWTANAVIIPQGETLITDGALEARTRCGNMLSETPMTPTSDAEPDAALFDIPENEIPGYYEPEQFAASEQPPFMEFGEPATPLSGGDSTPSRGVSPMGMSPGGSQYLPGLSASSGDPGANNNNTDPFVPGTPGTTNQPGVPDLPGTIYPPGRPGYTGTPDYAGVPDLPGMPGLPDTPYLPGIPDFSAPSEVPEPGTMVLLLTGLAAVTVIKMRRQKQ